MSGLLFKILTFVFLIAGLIVIFEEIHPRKTAQKIQRTAVIPSKALPSYCQIPMAFEVNQGQTDPQVKFLARGNGYTCFITPRETVLKLKFKKSDVHPCFVSRTLRMHLINSNENPKIEGVGLLPGHSNYFVGNNCLQWLKDIGQYSKIRLDNVYDGIDMIYYGNQGQLEYDFVVAPGADFSLIRLGFEGTQKINLDSAGNLVLKLGEEVVSFKKPLAYQYEAGIKQEVKSRFVQLGVAGIGFEVGSYDKHQNLFIDPVLAYSTYLGGGTNLSTHPDDVGNGIAVDGSGNAYIVGQTTSDDFPTLNPYQTSPADNTVHIFVSKINAAGTALVYSTYLRGNFDDVGVAIAVDSAGNAYITGTTGSTTFPVMPGAFQPTHTGPGGPNYDAFITKFNATGNALVYSTYLGGSADEQGRGIAVDSGGNAYITGFTTSYDFPLKNSIQTFIGPYGNAIVTKINSAGTSLIYSTCLGGSGGSDGYGIAIDSSGNAYVTGSTNNSTNDFPIVNPIQASSGGLEDAFVTKVNSGGSTWVYSTYLGGSGVDWGQSIAVDSSGNVYVVGTTNSINFPTLNPIQGTLAGVSNSFISKINSSGASLVYSTYLGGNGQEFGTGIVVDGCGEVYIVGHTTSNNFPIQNPLQGVYAGSDDAFVTKINSSGNALVFSTYFGGTGEDVGNGIAIDGSGNAYITGDTTSGDFPTQNPIQTTNANPGTEDVIVFKISSIPVECASTPSPTPTPVVSIPTPGCEIHVWPNPFNPRFASGNALKASCLPSGSTFSIFTLSGELVNKVGEIGGFVLWKGRNTNGSPVASGVYFYVIENNHQILQRGKVLISNN